MKLIKLNPNQRWAVISDLHIGHGYESTSRIKEILDENEFIIFCGDIFELFVNKWGNLKNEKGAWLLQWMRENPSRFSYIVGNHDADLWDEKLEFPIYDTVKVTQSKKTFLCIHGHQFDKMNRHRTNPWGRFVTKVESFVSRLFRVNIQNFLVKRLKIGIINRFMRRIQILEIRSVSMQYAKMGGCDYLIHGHSHFRSTTTTNDFSIIDIGGFMIGESYLVVENGLPEVKIIK